jgi:hypothetical protein
VHPCDDTDTVFINIGRLAKVKNFVFTTGLNKTRTGILSAVSKALAMV